MVTRCCSYGFPSAAMHALILCGQPATGWPIGAREMVQDAMHNEPWDCIPMPSYYTGQITWECGLDCVSEGMRHPLNIMWWFEPNLWGPFRWDGYAPNVRKAATDRSVEDACLHDLIGGQVEKVILCLLCFVLVMGLKFQFSCSVSSWMNLCTPEKVSFTITLRN